MQRISDLFERPCEICGCEMEIIKELENINDPLHGYFRAASLWRCKRGHEDVRELELDGEKGFFRASVYRKEEWEKKTKKEELSVIKLRDLLKTMDEFNNIFIVVGSEENYTCPGFALNIFKDSVLDMEVVRIDGCKIYIDGVNEQ